MQDFKQLQVWQQAHALAVGVYRATRTDPGRNHAELVGQVRRAALSIAANIAEGAGRNSPKDFLRFLSISIGSANELESHLMIARDVGFVSLEDAEAMVSQTQRVRGMLSGLSRRIRAREWERTNSRGG